jgi:hypothetical protein
MTFPFSQENTMSRQRLETMAGGLTDEQLARANADGWTVAALLAHLACWDQRHLHLIRRWRAGGLDDSPVDSTAVNESIKPLCLAIEPRAAVALCLASAAAIDAELETVSPELMAAIDASPNHYRFNRSLHRNGHLNEIESLVGQ